MDELISLSSSCPPHSPAAFFISTAGDPALEFMSCDVPEQWLLADDSVWPVGSSLSAETLEADAKKAAAPVLEEKLEVGMVGWEAAAVRLTTMAARHAPARLTAALRALDLAVQHACVRRVGAATVQDAVVDVPAALQDMSCLRATLLHTASCRRA